MLNVLPTHTEAKGHEEPLEVMDMLVTLIVEVASCCTHMSKGIQFCT